MYVYQMHYLVLYSDFSQIWLHFTLPYEYVRTHIT